jgi:anti-anti-sigma regulatory factor
MCGFVRDQTIPDDAVSPEPAAGHEVPDAHAAGVAGLAAEPDIDIGVLLAPRGRLTTADAAPLRDAALRVAAARQPVCIECADLDDLGGAALQVLVGLALDLRPAGARVRLAHLGPGARQTLSLAGATNLFDLA